MEQEEKLSLDLAMGRSMRSGWKLQLIRLIKHQSLCVYGKEEEIWKLFELTTDMGIPLEKNQTFLLPGYDLEQIVEFIKKTGLDS